MKFWRAILAITAAVSIAFVAFLYLIDAKRAHADVLHVYMDDAEITRRLWLYSSRAEMERFLFDARIPRGAFDSTDRTIRCELYDHDRLPFIRGNRLLHLVLFFDGDDKLSRVRVTHYGAR